MAREVSVVCGGMMVECEPFAMTMKLIFQTFPRYLSIPRDGGIAIAAPGLRTVCYIYDPGVSRQEDKLVALPLLWLSAKDSRRRILEKRYLACWV
jgi:hypothetical protein